MKLTSFPPLPRNQSEINPMKSLANTVKTSLLLSKLRFIKVREGDGICHRYQGATVITTLAYDGQSFVIYSTILNRYMLEVHKCGDNFMLPSFLSCY